MTGRELQWRVDGGETVVRIEESSGRGTFYLGDQAVPFVVHDASWIEIDGRNHRFYVHRNRDEYTVWIDGRTYRLTRTQKGQAAESTGAGSGEVRALMPGKILRVDIKVGD